MPLLPEPAVLGVAAGGMTLVFFAMFGVFFLLTQYFQLVLGYDGPEGRARVHSRSPASMMILGPGGARLAARIGLKATVVAAGMVVAAAGLLLSPSRRPTRLRRCSWCR